MPEARFVLTAARALHAVAGPAFVPGAPMTEGAHAAPLGKYANHFTVGHNAFEIVIDFGQCYEGDEGAQLHTRIVTSPRYAQILIEMLLDALDQHRDRFGAAPPE